MNKSERQKVFEKFGGKCSYCGCELTGRWHVDHAQSLGRDSRYDSTKKKYVYKGTCQRPENDRPDNYMPACASCNITKRDMSIEDFKKWIQQTVEQLNKNHYNCYKFGKRFGLIKETGATVVFYFETYTLNPII